MAAVYSSAALVVLLGVTVSASASPLSLRYDDDGMILVNGTRTLIIGSYYAAASDRPYAELAEAGFNLVHTGSQSEEMDQALAAGLMTWTSIGTIDLDNREASALQLVERVNAIKDHAALAFIETVDEPAWTWMKAESRVPAHAFAEAYPLIREADPNHLLYMNHAPTNLVKTMQAYNAGTDIVAMDIYPVNPGGLKQMYALFPDGHQGDLNNEQISQVGEYVDKMRRVTGPNRPLFMVLQGFAWENLVDEAERREEKILYPTYGQSRFMAFQSLIKGANGIIYWGTYTTPQPSPFWADLKRVTREVADLAGPLAQRTADAPVVVDYHEMGYSVDDGVQVLVKDFEGKRYVFTCNADKNICRATLSGLGAWQHGTVLSEDGRAVAVENGGITDVWKRFEVHVYALSN
ncbi:MAG TPA: hypothetical protein PLO37_08150 [Candidatus Hydrogenedentes bacterium]|nr:hypothetical protein [Candidatus Hydrogenedentota bacterium]HPG66803.1 hypothetical protein [Candidatus Hydrogenedentota bacterium]